MKLLIVVIICMTVIIPLLALLKSAGKADKRLEEIQRLSAIRKAGDTDEK